MSRKSDAVARMLRDDREYIIKDDHDEYYYVLQCLPDPSWRISHYSSRCPPPKELQRTRNACAAAIERLRENGYADTADAMRIVRIVPKREKP